MDENLHDIDKIFKDALEGHLEQPSGKVWEQLDRNLEKKKVISITNKYRRWKWVAAALFFLSAGMAMYTIQLKKKYVQTIAINEKSEKYKVTSTNKNKGNNRIPQPSETVTSQTVEEGVTMHRITKNVAKKTDTISSSSVVANTKSKIVKAQRSTVGIENVSTASPLKPIQEISRQNQFRSKATYNNTLPALASKKADQGEYLKPVDLKLIGRLNATNFAIDSIADVSAPSLEKTSNSAIAAAKKTVKISSAKPAGLSATILFSADAASAKLQEGHPYYREDNRHEIRKSENENTGYTLGVQLQKGIAKNISLVTGLAVTSRTSRINPKTLFARPDNNGYINFRISCSAGYAFISSKTGSRPASGDSVMAVFSKTNMQYVSIPIGLLYHINVGRFSINPTAFLSANIKTKGTIETLLQNAAMTSESNIQGLHRMYLDGALKLDLTYNISRSIGLSLFPTARFGITSITTNSPVKTFVNLLGMGTGLQFSF